MWFAGDCAQPTRSYARLLRRRSLMRSALDELSIPCPDLASPGQKVMHGGTTYARLPTDVLRFEVERIGADRSWQQPVDTVSRMVLEEVDRELLQEHGLELRWAAADHRAPEKFLIALHARDEQFQVFLRFPLPGRTPEEVAEEVVHTLELPPRRWRATYHSMVVGRRGRPSMAGWRWRSEDPWQ